MDRTAIEPTARNSDCQFCSVACQKSDVPREPSQVTSGWWCVIWSELNSLQPVTDCPNHDSSQIVAITITSEFEYSAVRSPLVRAHRGESDRACSPTSWSSSDSGPASSSCFDSGEPFCTNQTVSRMYSVNCRYSDCQFSSTALPKADDVR